MSKDNYRAIIVTQCKYCRPIQAILDPSILCLDLPVSQDHDSLAYYASQCLQPILLFDLLK